MVSAFAFEFDDVRFNPERGLNELNHRWLVFGAFTRQLTQLPYKDEEEAACIGALY